MDDPATDFDAYLTCLEHAHYCNRIAELEAQLAEVRRELESVADELGCTRDDLADMVRRIDKALANKGGE